MDVLKEKLITVLKQNSPFTAYHKPNTKVVQLLIQQDNKIHYLDDFSKSGFVFAPFDNTNKTIFFPLELTEKSSYEIKNEKLQLSRLKASKLTSKKTHIDLVKKGVNYIKNNQVPKIVLSRKEDVVIANYNVILTFFNLLKSYKTAFVYIWNHPKIGLWLGATPETLIQVKNKQFKTMSFAGTQEYVDTTDVKWEEKELEEQKIVTDYIVNNLTNLNIDCSKSDTFTTKAGNLLHLQTDIFGKLKDNTQLKSLITNLHPTPAVCGYPKEDAKQFILDNEGYNREYYTGFLGELNFESIRKRNRKNIENHAYQIKNTTTNLFVNLRCMQVKNNTINIYVGGGITKDSNAELEFLETIAKSKTIKKCL